MARGPIANIEIGVELKILAKAMIKQIDRVKGDLQKQAGEFRRSEARAIVVAIVGVNHSGVYCSFEGNRCYPTDGKKYKHPIQEAADATLRIEAIRNNFDELLILSFRATNQGNFPFEWVDSNLVRQDYASLLVRVSRLYEQRF